MVVIWLAIAGLSRLRMPRWSLPVVTGILVPCCYAVAYSTHIFLFALLMAIFAISTLLLFGGGSRRQNRRAWRVAARRRRCHGHLCGFCHRAIRATILLRPCCIAC